jgi:hypothetical protein
MFFRCLLGPAQVTCSTHAGSREEEEQVDDSAESMQYLLAMQDPSFYECQDTVASWQLEADYEKLPPAARWYMHFHEDAKKVSRQELL